MNIRIRNLAINTILIVMSTLLGILTINQFIIYISNNNNQRQDFSRKLLQYLEPIARWTYPDYKNSVKNSKSLFIVGDSYAEGAGDLYLKDSYKYSIGHFLDEKWRKNTNIYLAANSGSHIPAQLQLLEKHLRGDSKNLTGMPIKSETFNLILYFYEGNDLENTLISKKLPFDSFTSKLRFKLPIFYTVRRATSVAKNKILSKFPKRKKVSLSSKKILHNNVCIGDICRKIPPMQTASAGLSEKEIINEINYFEDSVKKFSTKYPKANMCLVYIPSPATIYSPSQDFYYQKYLPNKSLKTDSKSNNKKSLLIRRLLRDRFNLEFMTFVDPTKTIQKEAFDRFIHGKRDPKHFNEHGYKLIADATSQGCSLR
ncbi:MAG: hypothetical protein JJ844_02605 [Prochlorococcus marinus CUG1435]|nr:hypothetical protein [Prochlorococcus marinus CUG1435]